MHLLVLVLIKSAIISSLRLLGKWNSVPGNLQSIVAMDGFVFVVLLHFGSQAKLTSLNL